MAATLLLGIALPASTFAQAGAVSQPVVQALPNRNSLTLNQALARLGQNPRDIDALIDAGNAALAMGDVEASVGFFRRADQIAPGHARVKAGLAGALVHSENPFDAIPMFEEAERAGAGEGTLAGERGLAYDLVGDNEKAQRFYRQALAKETDDEIVRRFALSYAIAGDRKQSEAILNPLLQRQDKAAWRTRAFSLAILGQVDEAVSIANSTLPPSLAAGISPYLRYMPRLTPAQQAAAANLGHFPRASEIGRDDPRVALYAPKTPRRSGAQVASADAALTPRGQPLGRNEKARSDKTRSDRARRDGPRNERTREDRRSRSDTALAANTANATSWRNTPATSLSAPRRPATAAATSSASSRSPASSAPPAQVATAGSATPTQTAPPRTAAAPAASRPVAPPTLPPEAPARTTSIAAGSPLSAASMPAAAVQGPPAPVQGPPAPAATTPSLAAAPSASTTLAAAPPATVAAAPVAATPAAAAPAPSPAPAAAPVKIDLADAFSDFLRPTIDVAPVEGAVDVRRLVPSRQATETKPTQGKAAAAKPAKPPAPSHPSRIWVQVATGRDKAALAFDWRKMVREDAQVLRGKNAFISAWGQTNRLLTGPFPSEAAANTFIGQLRRAGIEGSFLWNSPAGQVVDPIAGK